MKMKTKTLVIIIVVIALAIAVYMVRDKIKSLFAKDKPSDGETSDYGSNGASVYTDIYTPQTSNYGSSGYTSSYSSSSSSILKRGSKGSDVVRLQKKLIEKGYNVGNTGADGDFGKNTESALVLATGSNSIAVADIDSIRSISEKSNGSAPAASSSTSNALTPALAKQYADWMEDEMFGTWAVITSGDKDQLELIFKKMQTKADYDMLDSAFYDLHKNRLLPVLKHYLTTAFFRDVIAPQMKRVGVNPEI